MAKRKEQIIELRPIRYNNRYWISDFGKVYYNTKCWRNPKGELKELVPSYNPSGYLYYKLSVGKCKYDFATCGCPIMNDLLSQQEELTKAIKEREKFLKTIPPQGLETLIEDEVVTLYPPQKTSTTSISVNLK